LKLAVSLFLAKMNGQGRYFKYFKARKLKKKLTAINNNPYRSQIAYKVTDSYKFQWGSSEEDRLSDSMHTAEKEEIGRDLVFRGSHASHEPLQLPHLRALQL
jgi:ribosomal protein L15E